MKKEVKLGMATRLINHGPLVMVSSRYGDRMDVTPVAWNMPIEKDPPVILLEIGEKHFIYECIMATGDFVVNIPSAAMADIIVKCGSCSGRDTDKFESFGISRGQARSVSSPVMSEALAVLECELLRDEHLLKEYNLVPGRVKYAEAESGAFDEHWLFEKEEFKTIHHLGNRTFCSPGDGVVDLRAKG